MPNELSLDQVSVILQRFKGMIPNIECSEPLKLTTNEESYEYAMERETLVRFLLENWPV